MPPAPSGALVAWAERREEALRAARVRDRRLTDLDLPRAVDPTIYVGLSLFDRRFRPQWLFSIHAEIGMLGVSFQYMGHPPFGTEVGREPLRATLNGRRSTRSRASASRRSG